MRKNKVLLKFLGLGLILFFVSAFISAEVWARAGGGMSGGSRGSRSFSAPKSTSPGTSQYQSPSTPSPMYNRTPTPQPSGSPFLRGLAGGLVGGFLGNMLFGGMGHGWGGGGFGGSGMGFLEIILIGVLIFIVFRFIRNRRQAAQSQNLYEGQSQNISGGGGYSPPPYQQPETYAAPAQNPDQDVATGIAHIRSMDYNFDPAAFKDWVQDLFFKIQAAWGNQDLAPINSSLTDQMRGIFQQDLDTQKAGNRVNHLENIAVRSVDITEVWQEEGKDFITVLFYANLLDYTVDKTSGNVLSGSKTEPVKFREFWTFVRPVGGRSPWQLSAINQEN
jgi:predicted lipid-binding transport protein (Tim44 family)